MPLSASFYSKLSFGPVNLRVRDLARVSAFYSDTLGFRLKELTPGRVAVTDHDGVVEFWILESAPEAKRPAAGASGLFHAAVLFPNRAALGRVLLRLVEKRVKLGAADHGVSEALYVEDPEGNGVELYVDRPPERWPREMDGVNVAMVSDPLDYEGLAKEGLHSLAPIAPTGTRMGHLHLKVSNLDVSEKFYAGALGLTVRQRTFPGALFLGREGYHHHLGLNVWQSKRPATAGTAGLSKVTFLVHDTALYAQMLLAARDGGYVVNDKAGRVLLGDPDSLAIELLADGSGVPGVRR